MKNKIQNMVYGYNPGEFFPVWQDGKLLNRNAFIAYKIQKLVTSGRLV